MTTPPDEAARADASKAKHGSDEGAPEEGRLLLAAVGMEAEFTLVVDDRDVRPESLFGSPKGFIRGPLMHRRGTSYHLPTGGIVYFDTGVIELATPVIEIEPGCATRAGRSLWESIRFVRRELDAWERRTGRTARLVGFSTHYNISFELPVEAQGRSRTVGKLAELLAYVLPVPVMLLAANPRSTGVGVRPRGDRIEVTVDFTPSAALTIATGTLITGVVREAMTWPSFELDQLAAKRLPVIAGYSPMPHTSRKGWLARFDTFPANPFRADIDRDPWRTTDGETLTLREMGARITRRFWRGVRRISGPFTSRLIASVMRGRAHSLLELPDRPPQYEDVGRGDGWRELFPDEASGRSRYERVIMLAISGRRLRLAGRGYVPVGMRGWSQVVFAAEDDGSRRVLSIDELVGHLDAWERGPRGRVSRRAAAPPTPR